MKDAERIAELEAALRRSELLIEQLQAQLNLRRRKQLASAGQSAPAGECEAEIERLRMQLVACGVVALANTPKSAGEARQMHPDYMSASCSDVANAVDREMTLRQQRDKLAKVLEDVEREHDLIRRMKNCEIHRGRGSFGIAVMSDPLALEWQALDKELQQLIDDRRATLSEPAP